MAGFLPPGYDPLSQTQQPVTQQAASAQKPSFLSQFYDILPGLEEQGNYGRLSDIFLSNRGGKLGAYAPSYRSFVNSQADRLGTIYDVLGALSSDTLGGPGQQPYQKFQNVFGSQFGQPGAEGSMGNYQNKALNLLRGGGEAVGNYEAGLGSSPDDIENRVFGVLQQLLRGRLTGSQLRTRFSPTRIQELQNQFDVARRNNPNIGSMFEWLASQGVY